MLVLKDLVRISGFFVALMLLAQPAAADPSISDKAAAETLFVEARKLLAAGKYAEACKALTDSQRLDPGVGTLLNLGRCYEKLGKTASAWTMYREATAAARASRQPAREKNARTAAEALEPKLAKLTLVVTGLETTPQLQVTRDGEVVNQAVWGSAVAIDPGPHQLEASAPGRKPWRGQMTAEPGKIITVTVPTLEPDAAAAMARVAKPSAPVPSKAAAPPPAADEVSRPAGLGAQRVVAIVAAGGGLVSTAVAGYYGLRAQSTFKSADCDGNNSCTQAGLETQDRALGYGRTATVALAGGLVAIATGVVLWVTAPSRPTRETADALPLAKSRLWVSADPIGETRSLTVTGTF